jgi:hypothetical protein
VQIVNLLNKEKKNQKSYRPPQHVKVKYVYFLLVSVLFKFEINIFHFYEEEIVKFVSQRYLKGVDERKINDIGFEVSTAVTTPCSSCKNRRFGVT